MNPFYIVFSLCSFMLPLCYCSPVVTMMRPLTGPGITNDKSSRGYWDGDLGVAYSFQKQLSFMLGDVNTPQRTPNAIAVTDNRNANWTQWKWHVDAQNGDPIPFFPLLGKSTVPAGAIYLEDQKKSYVFMMNVSDWGNGMPGHVHANGMLAESDGYPNFSFEIVNSVRFPLDSYFVNAAPILINEANKKSLYIIGSGLYRHSPLYLAKVAPEFASNLSEYEFFSGLDNNNNPKWSKELKESAVMINANAGELSVQWNAYLKRYVLSYFDWQEDGAGQLILRTAANIWGPWSQGTVIWSTSYTPDWYERGWYGPYGSYLLPPEFNENQFTFFTLSLWNPYRAFLMKLDLSTLRN